MAIGHTVTMAMGVAGAISLQVDPIAGCIRCRLLLRPSSPRVPRHDPAELLCLLVCRCPGKGKKPWEANLGFFVLIVPPRKGAGDELIVLGFFVNDTETRARHRHEYLVVKTSTVIFDPRNQDSFMAVPRVNKTSPARPS